MQKKQKINRPYPMPDRGERLREGGVIKKQGAAASNGVWQGLVLIHRLNGEKSGKISKNVEIIDEIPFDKSVLCGILFR